MPKKENLDWIRDFIQAHADRPMKIKELAKAIGVKAEAYPAFRRGVKDLITQGKLVHLKRGRIGLPDQMDLVTGVISLTRSGFGFVKCDNSDEEIFIAARDLHTSFDGDRVMVRLKPGRGFKDKREGAVLKILERKTTKVVGKFKLGRGYAYVVPDSKNVHRDIYITKGQTARARDGEKVVVQLEEWTDPYLYPEGRIIERLGMAGDPEADTLSIIRKYDLPTEFPAAVESEAEAVAADWSKEENNRRDLTKLVLFTIDPADAKDHDDAVSIEKKEDRYRLGVHIADVSHFVRGGSKLDAEAFERGTSVYFPDRVIPMLPEKLSNDVCSLRANRKRLAMTIFIDFDQNGNVLDHEICQSVIKSRAKLSYDEVQAFFDGGTPDPAVERVAHELLLMRDLARILLKRRQEAGSLDFDLPEAKITLDDNGNVVDIGNRVRLESHRLIEEFMLAANREVALHFFRNAQPILYRVHDRPDMEKLEAFAHFAKAFGYTFPVSPTMPTRAIAGFLDTIKGKPEEDLLNELLLRSMKKAVYQPENLGHFGLAFTHYLHFTSPIRRYPDLLVHRLLKQLKNGRYPVKLAQKLDSVLTNVGKQSSEMERRAMEAEREAVKAKQTVFMAEHVGWEYEGIISGILNFGFFVRLVEPGCEGLVRVSTLDDDYYAYDEAGYRMVGRRHGRVFRLGDKVRVGILKVDVEAREIDLFLVKTAAPRKAPKEKRSQRRRKR
ncbi:MAG: ribonuclease R [candidate division Zixibacteria bacterium]|nr:ribonuclease R [candidate division Zixibacteria bacterium]